MIKREKGGFAYRKEKLLFIQAESSMWAGGGRCGVEQKWSLLGGEEKREQEVEYKQSWEMKRKWLLIPLDSGEFCGEQDKWNEKEKKSAQ